MLQFIRRFLPIASVICLIICISCEKKSFITDREGAIIRGSTDQKKIALTFTGDSLAEGRYHVLKVLTERKIKGSFFFTGNFYRIGAYQDFIEKLIENGHYLGPHSDQHLLYCDWSDRDNLLIGRQDFNRDLAQNFTEMARFGLNKSQSRYFMPPYEWYNQEITTWSQAIGLTLINFTPGIRTNADYTYPEMGEKYINNESIWNSIFKQEESDPDGLKGYIILIHLGTDIRREEKFYHLLEPMIIKLHEMGYDFVRIDQLLK